MGWKYVFQKFLNKPMERESDFGGGNIFKNSIAPESQLVCP